MTPSKPAMIGISGFKNSGKTTLTSKLIAALSARGYVVSSIKHAHHAFDLDQEGTDTDKHRRAGAREVAIASAKRWAIMHETPDGTPEPSLDEISARLSPCDIVVIEGYKDEGHMKLVMIANENQLPLLDRVSNIVAVIAARDVPLPDMTIPVFDRDDIDAITAFVVDMALN